MNVNWERLWRMNGINFVIFFIIAYVIYGDQPKVGASAEKLVSFYDAIARGSSLPRSSSA